MAARLMRLQEENLTLNEISEVEVIMKARAVIARNCTSYPEYDEASFTAILHEQGVWQRDQYWLLEWALYDLVSAGESYDESFGPVFRIFSYTMNAIISHFDQNDFFEIKNLGQEEIYEFRERIQIIFEGFFAKRLPERVTFDEVNPLLPGGKDVFNK